MAKAVKKASEESKSVISKERAAEYEKTTLEAEDGSKIRVIDNGDDLAQELRGLSEKELEALAKQNGIGDRWKGWAHLNPGMRRMNLGNVLRGLRNAANGDKAPKKAAPKKAKAPAPKKVAKRKTSATASAAA